MANFPRDFIAIAEERDRLRQELSLAEEGLANYAQEVHQLRALLSQAPIALLTINAAGEPAGFTLYTPGLPPGEHDVYLMPEVSSSGHPSGKRPKCGECDNEMDPDWCWCGDAIADHKGMSHNHSPVPMGCTCGMRLPPLQVESAERQNYTDPDGCPTELAVLKRFWREHQPAPMPSECAHEWKYFETLETLKGGCGFKRCVRCGTERVARRLESSSPT